MTPRPPRAKFQKWVPGTQQDPAAYTVDPGSVTSRTKATAGNLAHVRPYIASGNKLFVFPVGVQGFSRSGTAGLGIHKYLGDNAVEVHVFHREEGRIVLRGTFPGLTSQPLMVECLSVLTSAPPEPGLILVAPGVFEQEQYVRAEEWSFDHDEEDFTHSITYNISLLRSGTGKKLKDKPGTRAPANPSVSKKPRSKQGNIYVVSSGAQTFRQMAGVLYHDPDKWQRLIALNAPLVETFQKGNALNKTYGGQVYSLPTFRWEIGTKINY